VRVKLFIATVDVLYAKLISDNISEYHADKIDVSICSALESLQEELSKRRYDAALIDPVLIEYADISRINLPLILWAETETTGILPEGLKKINKYQRISAIVSSILEQYSKMSGDKYEQDSGQAKITAVWSPAGGVGKTTVAMSYALSSAADGKEVFYLNLEDFTSVPGYFSGNGKSISTVFEMLENQSGNVKMLIQGVSCCDKGITYLCAPDNYEDLCILSSENIHELVTECAKLASELVIDLSSSCDIRTKKAFELANDVLIVISPAVSSNIKLDQFLTQNNVFESIKEKVTLVANKGATVKNTAIDSIISLPYIQSNDVIETCKMLAENTFAV